MTPKKYFPEISPTAWEHPADSAALAAFTSIDAAVQVVRQFVSLTNEKSFRYLALANMARVSENQFTFVHHDVREACDILDADFEPEVFVSESPVPNAMVLGVDHPYIVLTSAALELFDERELAGVIGHEVAHCLSGHAVYKTLLRMLVNGVALGASALGAGGIALALAMRAVIAALQEWDRKSELSADRAALLVTQDPLVVYTTLMKTAGGRRTHEMDINEFFRQAHDYDQGGDLVDSVYKIMGVLGQSHPFAVTRMVELQRWERSGDYQKILNGEYPRRGTGSSRDFKRDFDDMVKQYRDDLKETQDPLGKMASEVIDNLSKGGERVSDLLNGIFGRPEGGDS
jgi:Zn-dependent protease with chaperone function